MKDNKIVPRNPNHGYWRSTLINNNKTVSVHVFVWECFKGASKPEGMVIHHIDSDTTNAKFTNLKLVTVEQNNHCSNKVFRKISNTGIIGVYEK